MVKGILMINTYIILYVMGRWRRGDRKLVAVDSTNKRRIDYVESVGGQNWELHNGFFLEIN